MVTVISNATRPPEPVGQLARGRIEEFRATRDEGIAAGTSYTFSDGTAAVIPTAVPNQATRMQGIFMEAQELVKDGNGTSTLVFEDVQGLDVEQPASEIVQAARAAVQRGQDWQRSFRDHKQAILAIQNDTSLTDDEKRSKIADYDPANNGGWPS